MVHSVIHQLEERLLENGTDAKDLKSYRALPRMFDRIFHPPQRLACQRSGTSPTELIVLQKTPKMDSEAERRPRSHSADLNDPNTSPQLEKIIEDDLEVKNEALALESNKPEEYTEESSFYKAKQDFLRRMEAPRTSPTQKVQKIQYQPDQII